MLRKVVVVKWLESNVLNKISTHLLTWLTKSGNIAFSKKVTV